MSTDSGASAAVSHATNDPACGCSTARHRGRLAVGALVLMFLAGVLWSLQARGGDQDTSSAGGAGDTCALFDHEHAAWTALLSRYVQNGFADYAALEQTGQPELRYADDATAAALRSGNVRVEFLDYDWSLNGR